MDKTLTPEEMDALLGPETGLNPAQAGSVDRANRKVAVYDFRRPDRVPKPVLHALQMLHDRFCNGLSASLSGYFRMLSEVGIVSIEQTNFSEFLQSTPDPACLTALSLRPLSGVAILDISLNLAFPLIDRLLGGPGHVPDANRKMTEIEKNVIQGVIKLINNHLVEAWQPVTEVGFHIHACETRPQFAQVAPATEVVVVFTIEVKLGETRGALNLCYPYSALEPIAGKFEQQGDLQTKPDSYSGLSKLLRTLLRTPLEITSELPKTMVSVQDLLTLAKGDVITLDPKIDDGVELLVGGQRAFQARMLDMDGRKAAGVIRRLTDSN